MSYLHPIWSHSLSTGGCGALWGLSPAEDGISHVGMKYECLHFYFLTNAANLLDDDIFCDNYDGISFVRITFINL
jgi:hypothetical protein